MALKKDARILHLTLRREPFEMIASGEKKEEYREPKEFWKTRLTDQDGDFLYFKEFDAVHFRNGYSPKSPTMLVECKGIKLDYGKQKWGAEKGLKYFVIKLGKILQAPKSR